VGQFGFSLPARERVRVWVEVQTNPLPPGQAGRIPEAPSRDAADLCEGYAWQAGQELLLSHRDRTRAIRRIRNWPRHVCAPSSPLRSNWAQASQRGAILYEVVRGKIRPGTPQSIALAYETEPCLCVYRISIGFGPAKHLKSANQAVGALREARMTRIKAFLIASLAAALGVSLSCGGGDATATPTDGSGGAQPTARATATTKAGATATTKAGPTTTAKATTKPASTATARPGNVGTADWCVAGTSWGGFAGLGGVQGVDLKIVGIVDFKGKRFCHASYKGAYSGQEIDWSYYFTEQADDIWWVNRVAGQEMEQHLVGG